MTSSDTTSARGGLAAAGVGLAALMLYVRTLAPGVTEVDSGELAAVAATLGIAHPSGYPLFTWLGAVATQVTPFAPVFATNLLSALLAAGAVWLLHRTLFDTTPAASPAARHVGAAVGALGFAVHPLLWSVAIVTEVHALQMFLVTALLHGMVRSGLWGDRPLKGRGVLFVAYASGLLLANHLTGALLLPAVAWVVWRRVRFTASSGVAALGAFALGVSAYLYLPLRSARLPMFDWGAPRTWEAFGRHVSGAQYRSWMFAAEEVLAKNLAELGDVLAAGGAWLFLPLLALGVRAIGGVPRLRAGVGLMLAAALCYPLTYAIPDIALYFLPALLLLCVVAGLGAQWLAERWPRPAFALLGLPLIVGGLNFSAQDRSDERWIETMGRSFLETPAEGGLLLTSFWDLAEAPALYLQAAEGVRPDVRIVDPEHLRRAWYFDWLRRSYPDLVADLAEPLGRLEALVRRFERDYDGMNPVEQRAFAAEIQPVYVEVLGRLVAAAYERGGAWVSQEVTPDLTPGWARIPDGMLLRLESPQAPARELFSRGEWPEIPPAGEGGKYEQLAQGYAARMAAWNAQTSLRAGRTDHAAELLERALAWNPGDALARELEAELRRREADAPAMVGEGP